VVPPNFISNETLLNLTSTCPAEPTGISELQLESELSIQDLWGVLTACGIPSLAKSILNLLFSVLAFILIISP
jgi:hypothetical protein